MAIRGVLFDLFGTLVDYDAGRTTQDFGALADLVESVNLSLDVVLGAFNDAFAHLDNWTLATGREYHMDAVANEVLTRLPVDSAALLPADLIDAYITGWSSAVTPVPGIDTFITGCSRHFATGVVTNTHYPPMVEKLLREMRVDNVVQTVVTSVEHGRPKPDPSIFEVACRALDLPPAECLYVGDNYQADYVGATNAGLTCYLVGQHARVPREYQLPSVLDLSAPLRRIVARR